MHRDPVSTVGFEHRLQKGAPARHPAASIELLLTVALALSTMIAATAVSIGIARAATARSAIEGESMVALALVLGLILAGMGSLTALVAGVTRRRDSGNGR